MERIQHFGVWIKKNEKNKISRSNYAVIDKKSSTWSPGIGELRRSCYKTIDERKKVYDDEDCKIYSDAYCKEWQEKCLVNFDMNMAFFKSLSKEDFEEAVQKLVTSKRKIKQILDLNECKELCGIYVMVLDEYKQVYIGQAQDVKKRILQHWNKRKPFDRLIFGNVNNSVLSIDSFGALDTTRIFVLETGSLESAERFLVNKMPSHFKLNRIGGGTVNSTFDFWQVLAEGNQRKFEG